MVELNDRHYAKTADLIRDFGVKDGIQTLDLLHLSAARSLRTTKFPCSDKVLSHEAFNMGIKLAQRCAGLKYT
jgi:hypothetical protein